MILLHYFQPNQILAQIGPIAVYWYGLMLALAMLAAVSLAWHLTERSGLKTDDLLDLALWAVAAGLIGARLYDVLVIDWRYFSHHPVEIFYIWQGGLAIHGAIAGGAIALLAWCKIKKQNPWPWLDIAAVALPLAQAIGRWGNYFNSELFGGPTNLPWGIPIAENLRPLIYKSYQYFQPAFLYESILDLILFIALLVLFKKNRLKSGQVFGLYLIGYGLIRFLMEFIRIDATAMFFNIRAPQLMSLGLVLAGLIIIVKKSK